MRGRRRRNRILGIEFCPDPGGRILQAASQEREEVLVVPVDFSLVETTRTHWPFLRDRRLDAYADLTRRYLDDR